MSVNYSQTAINFRMQGVVSAIDDAGNGVLRILGGSTILSSITLQNPCGTVTGTILTFTGNLIDASAANTGNASAARIEDANGLAMISGLTVGIPGSGADILITNGLNSTLVTAGQTVAVVSAQITGS